MQEGEREGIPEALILRCMSSYNREPGDPEGTESRFVGASSKERKTDQGINTVRIP